MNAALRHFSVRLWLTALTGGMASISLLPWWQKIIGIAWLGLPAAAIVGACFAGTGWVMNRVGVIFLNRHVHEATVWERAGMMAEAEAAFHKAMATFDSFWLSPILRRGKFQWFSGLMARFYLGQHSERPLARVLTAVHLENFPQDKAVAEPWLEQLLTHERHLPQEHEAAASVSARHANHHRIQSLLMQYYLANGRIDFDAQQTYRRVWKRERSLPRETLVGLARLLRNEYILNHWALQVYMKAVEAGDHGAFEGISAAVQWLPATEESRHLLNQAKIMLARMPHQGPVQPDSKFKPDRVASLSIEAGPGQYAAHPAAIKTAPPLLTRVRQWGDRSALWFTNAVFTRHVRRALPGIVIGAGLMIVTVAGWRFFSTPPKEPPAAKTVVEETVVIADPFTIQVAAYLRPEDAQRLVDDLKKTAIDAFWTQAKSASRTWYQVKVSHFVDRKGAQEYGQQLKAKGLIDDFYVANYDHEDRNRPASDVEGR
jgi:hypothetical protein